MAIDTLSKTDPLTDFEARKFSILGKDRLVYVAGNGPAVIVMTEMTGISPHVARFARWVRDAGFTVYMPHIFGKDGAIWAAQDDLAMNAGEIRDLVAGFIDPAKLSQLGILVVGGYGLLAVLAGYFAGYVLASARWPRRT